MIGDTLMIKVLKIRLICNISIIITFGLLCFSCDTQKGDSSLQSEGTDSPNGPKKYKDPPDTTDRKPLPPSPHKTVIEEPFSPKKPVGEEPSPPEKNDVGAEDDIPFKKFLSDPELQLWEKSPEELKNMVLGLKESVLKDNWESLFSLVEIRIIQRDDQKANQTIEYLITNNLSEFLRLIKKAEIKHKEITDSIKLDKITYKTQDLFEKITFISIDYAALIGQIKGKTDAIARIKGITLPADF